MTTTKCESSLAVSDHECEFDICECGDARIVHVQGRCLTCGHGRTGRFGGFRKVRHNDAACSFGKVKVA